MNKHATRLLSFVTLLLLALVCVSAQGQSSLAKYSQVRIYFKGQNDFLALANAGLGFDHIDSHATYFDTTLNNDELELLRKTSWRYEVLVDDLGAEYRSRPRLSASEMSALEAAMREQYHINGFGF